MASKYFSPAFTADAGIVISAKSLMPRPEKN